MNLDVKIPLQDESNPWLRALGLLIALIVGLPMLALAAALIALCAVLFLVLLALLLVHDLFINLVVRPGSYILFKLLRLPRP